MVHFLTALTGLTALCAAIALGSINIRRAGWLDRLVAYHKKKFFDDLKKLPLIHVKATIERAPPGYVDSQDWDYDSVIRLLSLIRDSDGAKTVRRALRRSMQSSRRFMSFAQSLKAFPSLAKDNENDFYYDVDSGEYYADVDKKDDDSRVDDKDIIVVSNPVEARLPSTSISVKLLKSILENRAKAGRYMTTTKKKIQWSSTSKKAPKASKSPVSSVAPNSSTSTTTTEDTTLTDTTLSSPSNTSDASPPPGPSNTSDASTAPDPANPSESSPPPDPANPPESSPAADPANPSESSPPADLANPSDASPPPDPSSTSDASPPPDPANPS